MESQVGIADERTTRALVHLTLDQFRKQKVDTVPKHVIHKVLYLAKQKTPDNDLIKNSFTFFWHRYGPFSEELDQVIKSMADKSIIRYHVNGYQLAGAYNAPRRLDSDESFQELEQTIVGIVKDNTPDDILNTVYGNPKHPWYVDYIKFQTEFKKYVYLSNEDGYLSNNKILELFYRTLDAVPSDTAFKKFYLSYYSFSRTFIPLVKNYSPCKHRKIFEYFDSLVDDIWNAFAYYSAIMYHEQSHEKNVKDWKSILDNRFSDIQTRIESMNDIIRYKPNKKLAKELENDLKMDTSTPIYTPEELLAKITPAG